MQSKNKKNDLNMEAHIIDHRNVYWSQLFNQILISLAGLIAMCPAVVVLAALESACLITIMIALAIFGDY